MKTIGAWGGLLLAALAMLACSSTTRGTAGGGSGGMSSLSADGKRANGGECSGATGSGSECSGGICITLTTNAQNKGGICTSSCATTGCGPHETCEHVAKFNDSICLRTCSTNGDCFDGFVCSEGICLTSTSSASPASSGSAASPSPSGSSSGSPPPSGSSSASPPPSGSSSASPPPPSPSAPPGQDGG